MGMTAAAGEAGTGRANVARWSSAVGEHHRGAVPRRKEAPAMVKAWSLPAPPCGEDSITRAQWRYEEWLYISLKVIGT